MADEPNRRLRCGSHPVDAEIHDSQAGPARVRCPVCGRTDTRDFAEAEAAKAELGGAIGHAIARSSASDAVPPPPDMPEPRWVFEKT